jgi:hypothetical protein
MSAYTIYSDNNTTVHAPRNGTRERGAGVFDTPEKNLADPIRAGNQRLIGSGHSLTGIRPVYPYTFSRNSVGSHPVILFNKTPEQLRRIGSLGGKAYGRNRRARRALMPLPPPAPPRARAAESTVAAIAALDAQFPWLRSAERRRRKLNR